MRPSLFVALCLTAGLVGGSIATALAARNSSGTYSLYTPGNPVVTGTTVGSAWANHTLTDIGTELTDSLSRSGKGGMLASLSLINGTVGTPSLNWTNSPSSGFYRVSADDLGLAISGVKVHEWTSALETVVKPLSLSSTLAVTGATTLTGGVTGGLTINSGTFTAGSTNITSDVSWYSGAFQINSLNGNTTMAALNASSASIGNTSALATVTVSNSHSSGSCVLSAGSPSVCTATVTSGCVPVCSFMGSGSNHAVGCAVSATTLSVITDNLLAGSVAYHCF